MLQNTKNYAHKKNIKWFVFVFVQPNVISNVLSMHFPVVTGLLSKV